MVAPSEQRKNRAHKNKPPFPKEYPQEAIPGVSGPYRAATLCKANICSCMTSKKGPQRPFQYAAGSTLVASSPQRKNCTHNKKKRDQALLPRRPYAEFQGRTLPNFLAGVRDAPLEGGSAAPRTQHGPTSSPISSEEKNPGHTPTMQHSAHLPRRRYPEFQSRTLRIGRAMAESARTHGRFEPAREVKQSPSSVLSGRVRVTAPLGARTSSASAPH